MDKEIELVIDRMAEPLQDMENAPLLDIGCGTGVVGRRISNTKNANMVTYLDSDVEALQIAARLDEYSSQYIVSDLRSPLPFLPNSICGIVGRSVLTYLHIDACEQLFQEMFRVMRSGGTLSIAEPAEHALPFTTIHISTLYNLAVFAGFEDVEMMTTSRTVRQPPMSWECYLKMRGNPWMEVNEYYFAKCSAKVQEEIKHNVTNGLTSVRHVVGYITGSKP